MLTDWQQIIFDPKNDQISRLDNLARKRFWDENIADEAFNWVLDKIKANNWSRLNSFNGKSKPSTYLHTVFLHALENFSREKFGYPRPRTWLKNRGDFWVQIWKRLCLEREPAEQIKATFADNNKQAEIDVKLIITLIKAKEPNCAKQDSLISIGGTDTDKNNYDDFLLADDQIDNSTEQVINAQNLDELLEIISRLTGLSQHKADFNQADETIKNLSDSLKMDDNELLILKMKFEQNMGDAAIARALNLSNYQVNTILKMVLSRLSKLFEDADIIFNN
jgi:hypothetical protein